MQGQVLHLSLHYDSVGTVTENARHVRRHKMKIWEMGKALSIVSSILWIISLHSCAAAQTTSPPIYFTTVLQTISTRYDRAFIAEAEPLHDKLSSEKAKALCQELEREGITEAEAVQKVADAFDYEPEYTDDGMYLLRKRYSDPTDLPDVTFDEIRHDLVGQIRMLSQFCPMPPDIRGPGEIAPENIALLQLKDSLSPEDIAAMSNGIAVSQLPLAAKLPAWHYACQYYLGPSLHFATATLDQLDRTRKKDAEFHWIDVSGLRAFGFTSTYTVNTRSGVMHFPGDFVLSHNLRTTVEGGTIITVPSATLKNGKFVAIPPDPTAPDNKPSSKPAHVSSAISLGDLVSQVNSHGDLGAKTGSDAKPIIAEVDPALAPKTVTLVGCEKLTPTQLLNGVSAVYGLRFFRADDGHLRVAFRPQPQLTLADLPTRIIRYLPDPLVREWYANARGKGPKDGTQVLITQHNIEISRAEAVRRLRETVQQRVKYPYGRLPMTAMTDTERKYLALIFMADCQGPFYTLISKPNPSYIADFDHAMIGAKVIGSGFMVTIGRLEPNGHIGMEFARFVNDTRQTSGPN